MNIYPHGVVIFRSIWVNAVSFGFPIFYYSPPLCIFLFLISGTVLDYFKFYKKLPDLFFAMLIQSAFTITFCLITAKKTIIFNAEQIFIIAFLMFINFLSVFSILPFEEQS